MHATQAAPLADLHGMQPPYHSTYRSLPAEKVKRKELFFAVATGAKTRYPALSGAEGGIYPRGFCSF